MYPAGETQFKLGIGFLQLPPLFRHKLLFVEVNPLEGFYLDIVRCFRIRVLQHVKKKN